MRSSITSIMFPQEWCITGKLEAQGKTAIVMSKKKSRYASGLYVYKINFFDLYNSTTIPQLFPEEIKRIVIKKCAI